jgi:hypothetical protein
VFLIGCFSSLSLGIRGRSLDVFGALRGHRHVLIDDDAPRLVMVDDRRGTAHDVAVAQLVRRPGSRDPLERWHRGRGDALVAALETATATTSWREDLNRPRSRSAPRLEAFELGVSRGGHQTAGADRRSDLPQRDSIALAVSVERLHHLVRPFERCSTLRRTIFDRVVHKVRRGDEQQHGREQRQPDKRPAPAQMRAEDLWRRSSTKLDGLRPTRKTNTTSSSTFKLMSRKNVRWFINV